MVIEMIASLGLGSADELADQALRSTPSRHCARQDLHRGQLRSCPRQVGRPSGQGLGNAAPWSDEVLAGLIAVG